MPIRKYEYFVHYKGIEGQGTALLIHGQCGRRYIQTSKPSVRGGTTSAVSDFLIFVGIILNTYLIPMADGRGTTAPFSIATLLSEAYNHG